MTTGAWPSPPGRQRGDPALGALEHAHGVTPAVDAHLLEQVVDVVLDGRHLDPERDGNFLVR
jgi:hypothetical protein